MFIHPETKSGRLFGRVRRVMSKLQHRVRPVAHDEPVHLLNEGPGQRCAPNDDVIPRLHFCRIVDDNVSQLFYPFVCHHVNDNSSQLQRRPCYVERTINRDRYQWLPYAWAP